MTASPLHGADLVGFVGSADLRRSRDFYESVLGLLVLDANPYACVIDAGGTALRVTKVDTVVVAPYTILGWTVADIEVVVDELRDRGVVFTCYEGMGQDDRDIWTAPGGARVTWFTDPDGQTLSLTQLDA